MKQHGLRGVLKSPEHRAKISAALSGRSPSADTRARMSRAQRERQVREGWLRELDREVAMLDELAELEAVVGDGA